MRKHTAFTGTLTIAALTLSTLVAGVAPASAGPDDGKIVTTKGHVDAPKTFWENNIFTLKNEANVYGNGPEDLDLEKTVNWVGKGWAGGFFNKNNQYIFTSTGSEALDFLGEAGKNYYLAPQRTSFNHDPIWAGFGADSNIPTDKFREGIFALDILSVDGPGTMDFFSYADFGAIPSALHMLSSQNLGLHSYLLQQGTHTHNNTVFSKPGRYEVTYRTVARSADGKESIASRPTTLVWQVGGQKPISGEGTPTGISTEDRYQSAPVGDLSAAGYKLTLTPHEGRENDGDDKLTDITFTSSSTQSGTLTLYNNGYFLTDLEVVDGKAVWPEMLGSETSQIQAVFTPADDQEGARWISPALNYAFGTSDETSSQAGEGSWPTKIKDERNLTLNQNFYTPTSANYTATLKPAPSDMPGYALLEVTFDDPNFRGFIRGGLYSERGAQYPQSEFEANVVDGIARQYIRASEYSNGTFPKVEVVPHPDMNALRSSTELDGSYVSGQSVHTAQGTMELTETPAQEDPTPAPTPSEPTSSPIPTDSPAPTNPSEPTNPADPSPEPTNSSAAPVAPSQPTASPTSTAPSESAGGKKCYYSLHENRSIIDQGHVDLQAKLQDGKLNLSLKDDTGIITPGTQQRSVNDVVFTVGENAKHHRNEEMMAPELDFIGEKGSEFYGLPQTQMQGIVWPGYSTENVDYSQLDGAVTLHIEPKTMPEDARFGLYEEGFSSLNVLMSSADKDSTHEIPFATHAHTNWIFTKAGHYSFDTYYTAKLKDGTEVKSSVQQLSFAVGKQAVTDCEQASPAPSASSSNQATDQPVAPSSQPSASSAAPVANYSPGASAMATVSAEPSAEATGSADANSTGGSEPSENAGVAGANHSPGAEAAQGSGTGTSSNGSVSGNQSATGSNSQLPHTGFAASFVALVAAGMLVAGSLVLAARRRKES